ncbi:DMT family transporter [Natronomonas salsuginis]|uniref:DMT family transporter n=1 Tax=Natronomonas salsuginis TaxID=2217661 RepID=A0A4U5JI26_9EURY|nr:DMT family transporter [Natronomonas salsuginis]TKR28156.1 DMT family transporter [Natronomonas salsuginis]
MLDVLEARTPPTVALAVAVVAVSTSAILVRWSDAPSVVLALYRVLLTTLLVAPFAFTRYRGAFSAFDRRDVLVATLTGAALAIHFAAYFESLAWTSVAASVTLVQSQPLFVAVGAAAFLHERIGTRKALGIAVAIAGMVAMSAGEFLAGAAVAGSRPLYGNGLAVLGAFMAAVYVLAGRSLRQRVAVVPYVLVVYTACALTLFAVAVAQDLPLTGYGRREWLLFFALAVGPGLFGHTVINWALEHVESSVVSVSLLGEPVGATILALLLLSETPGSATVAGGLVVLAGIYVTAAARA